MYIEEVKVCDGMVFSFVHFNSVLFFLSIYIALHVYYPLSI